MAGAIRIELLGPLRVVPHGRPPIEHFCTAKCALLLGRLALEPERAHPRLELGALLWPDKDERAQRNNLSTALSLLRKRLGGLHEQLLEADRHAVRLGPEHLCTDVALLEQHLRDSRLENASVADRIECLRAALALRRGPLLEGHFDDWVLARRSRIERRLSEASHRLVELLLSHGQAQAAHTVALAQHERDPLDRAAIDDVLRTCIATGQWAHGWSFYEAHYDHLQQRLGVGPARSTEALAERLREGLGATQAIELARRRPSPHDDRGFRVRTALAFEPGGTRSAGEELERLRRRGARAARTPRPCPRALFGDPYAAARAALEIAARGGRALLWSHLEPDTEESAEPELPRPLWHELARCPDGTVLCEQATALLLASQPDGLAFRPRHVLAAVHALPMTLYELSRRGDASRRRG